MASQKLSKSTATKSKEPKRTQASKGTNLSTEYVEDSSEAESDSEAPSSPVKKSKQGGDKVSKNTEKQRSKDQANEASAKSRTNGVQKKAPSPDTSDSDSSGSSRPAGKAQASTVDASKESTLKKKAKSPSSNGKSSGGDSSDDGSNSGDDSSEDGSEGTAVADVVMQDASEPARHSSRVAAARQTFTPPAGFKSTVIPKDLNAHSLFTSQNLSGKEVWHIIVPQNVPISAITAAPLSYYPSRSKSFKITVGETAAKHKGTDYMFVEDDSHVHRQHAYRPDAGSEHYSVCQPSISRTMRLQRKDVFEFGKPPAEATTDRASEPAMRVAPQQPQGLKMRYQPFGVSSVAHLSRISQPSKLRSSTSVGISNTETEKRTSSRTAAGDPHRHGSPSTKRRKHTQSTPKQEDPRASVDPQADEEEVPQEKTETPEERAQRKADRKQEKEERRARKAARRAKREADAASAV